MVSAEHVSSRDGAAQFEGIHPRLSNCRSSSAESPPIRPPSTSCEPVRSGVLVGVGPGAACTTRGSARCGCAAGHGHRRCRRSPHAAIWTRAAATFMSSADGGMRRGGDIAKAVACGADAVMIGSPLASAQESPGRGVHWGMATFHPTSAAWSPGRSWEPGDPRRDPRWAGL